MTKGFIMIQRFIQTIRRRALASAAVVLGIAAGAAAAQAQNYEVWALDQGTHQLHIFNPQLQETAKVDLAAHGVRVPHMIDFTPDGAYAFIASTASGDVTVMRTGDRSVAGIIKTGPGTHMAKVKPDGSAIIVDVIGDPKVHRDGKLVEITWDKAAGRYAPARSLVVAEDPLFKQNESKFKDTNPVCHDYSRDGRYAYVTLGPMIADGGLVVLDTNSFKLTRVFGPEELKVNCGTMRTPDGKHMLVNGGDHDVGVWYVLEIGSNKIVKQDSSRGHDAHGVWPTPDGREVWMVNRVSSNGIIIDPRTLQVVAELKEVGPTPDIMAMSPDGRYAFITTRGPNPVSAPHVAKGTVPGIAVVSIKDRKLVQHLEPGKGNDRSDFHGIAVRVIRAAGESRGR